MQIEYFQYIVTTAKYNTITKAAAELHLNQTTLSAAIKNTEAAFNITIFERGKHGISLTPEGREFVFLSQQLLNKYSEIQQLTKKENHKTLVLAAHYLASERYSVEIAQKFNMYSGSTSLHVTELPRTAILPCIASGEYHFGIGYVHLPDIEEFLQSAQKLKVCCEPLSTDTRYLYVSQDSFFTRLSDIRQQDLSQAHFAITENGLAEFKRSNLQKYITNYTVFSNIHLSRQAIESGNMCALYLSDDSEEDWFNSGTTIKKIPLPNLLPEQAQHFLLYKQNHFFTQIEKVLLDCIRDVISK